MELALKMEQQAYQQVYQQGLLSGCPDYLNVKYDATEA
jgi:hypothetical protein